MQLVDKAVDTAWVKTMQNNQFPVVVSNAYGSGGMSQTVFSGFMAFVMGIVAMVRLTRNVPRRLTEGAFYGGAAGPGYYSDSTPQMAGPDYISMMKRMADLEEKVNGLNKNPASMPPEKEEMLNTAVNRVNVLEEELSETKKVSFL